MANFVSPFYNILKRHLRFLCPQKVEKNHPQTPWAAQTAQTEEFMFQAVAYRPTVYNTRVLRSGYERPLCWCSAAQLIVGTPYQCSNHLSCRYWLINQLIC